MVSATDAVTQGPAARIGDLASDLLLEMYRRMLLIRGFEERVRDLFTAGALRGAGHFYIGEEAVAVGSCLALRPDDYITSTHRGHGHCIAKGGDVRRMMAELFGRETGYCRGRGGSMHIAALDLGMLGANGIVGGSIPLAVGAALSSHLRGTQQVAGCFFGDGAANQGAFHEAINLAAIWKLPVVLICENNRFNEHTPYRQTTPIEDVAVRATAYAIPGVIVDGMDPLAVYAAVGEAAARARRGDGPSLLECKTYRFEGHSVGDPAQYRTDEEVESWRQRDPIPAFRGLLLADGRVRESALAEEEEAAQAMVEEAVRFAEDSPPPDPAALSEGMFA